MIPGQTRHFARNVSLPRCQNKSDARAFDQIARLIRHQSRHPVTLGARRLQFPFL